MTEKPDSQENLERSIRPVSASFVVVGANRSALYAASWLKKAGAPKPWREREQPRTRLLREVTDIWAEL